ncbi:hypothetical protein EVAR_103620_1 [Eumeta japonica]|uniref:Uncharacterized protein n=1 Tax=Eumeta variegata TaxID=151549 RepID=A0A4C1SP30_EUMVA|nr:hypothetical protein EVAR_103620_1 [Eumeta japonica]
MPARDLETGACSTRHNNFSVGFAAARNFGEDHGLAGVNNGDYCHQLTQIVSGCSRVLCGGRGVTRSAAARHIAECRRDCARRHRRGTAFSGGGSLWSTRASKVVGRMALLFALGHRREDRLCRLQPHCAVPWSPRHFTQRAGMITVTGRVPVGLAVMTLPGHRLNRKALGNEVFPPRQLVFRDSLRTTDSRSSLRAHLLRSSVHRSLVLNEHGWWFPGRSAEVGSGVSASSPRLFSRPRGCHFDFAIVYRPWGCLSWEGVLQLTGGHKSNWSRLRKVASQQPFRLSWGGVSLHIDPSEGLRRAWHFGFGPLAALAQTVVKPGDQESHLSRGRIPVRGRAL